MRALRKLTAALACGSMLSWSAAPALATMPGQTVALLKRVDKGPGAPGFLPNCQGSFALMNWLTYTNTFTGTTNWAGASPGGANNPSFGTSKGDIAPDGTTSATDVTIPAVPSGTTNYSTVWIPTATSATNFASFNDWTFQIWVKDTTGAGTGNAFISVRAATTESGAITANSDTSFNSIFNNAYSTGYASTPIPNDGQWHLVSVWVPANFTPSNVHVFTLQVGVDRRDTAYQTTAALPGTSQSKTLVLWHAGFFNGHSEGGKGWQVENVPAGSIFTAGIQNDASSGPIGTTTPVNVTLACPYPLAVRDYTQLHPWIAGEASGTPPPTLLNGIAQLLVQSGTGYKYGGLGNPFWGSTASYQLTGTYAGQRCGFSSSTDGTTPNSTGTHNDWFTTFLSCGKDLWSTAEALPGNWQIQVPGSTIGTSNVGMSSPCNTTCGTGQSVTGASFDPVTNRMTVQVGVGTQVPTSVAVTLTGLSPSTTSGGTPENVNGTFPVVSTDATHITYQLPGSDPSTTWTYSTGGNAAGAAAMNSYILHAWMLPQNPATGAGCNVNSTNYTYCMMLSAKAGTNGNGGHSMFMAYSNTIDSAWCMYINDSTHSSGNLCANGASSTPGGATIYSPTPILSGAPTLIGGSTNTPMNAPSLPTILQVGGINYGNGPSGNVNFMITPGSSGTAYTWQLWADTAGDGFNWRYVGQVNPPPGTQSSGSATLSTDWDYQTGRIDPSLYRNKCGWLELNYTAFKSNSYQGRTGTAQSQAIGVMVATDIRGPYYLFNGPGTAWNGLLPAMNASGGIFPFDSNIFNNQKNVGETNVWDEYGKYFWSGNEDSGGGFSGAAGAYMADACQRQ